MKFPYVHTVLKGLLLLMGKHAMAQKNETDVSAETTPIPEQPPTPSESNNGVFTITFDAELIGYIIAAASALLISSLCLCLWIRECRRRRRRSEQSKAKQAAVPFIAIDATCDASSLPSSPRSSNLSASSARIARKVIRNKSPVTSRTSSNASASRHLLVSATPSLSDVSDQSEDFRGRHPSAPDLRAPSPVKTKSKTDPTGTGEKQHLRPPVKSASHRPHYHLGAGKLQGHFVTSLSHDELGDTPASVRPVKEGKSLNNLLSTVKNKAWMNARDVIPLPVNAALSINNGTVIVDMTPDAETLKGLRPAKTEVPSDTLTMLMTIVSTQKELSVPGYMELQPEVDFEMTDMLAQGGFGMLFLGTLKNGEAQRRVNGESRCTIKTFHQDKFTSSPEYMTSFYQEVAMMCYFTGHRNFVKILGFTQKPLAIVMKYYELGSLNHFVLKSSPPSSTLDGETAVALASDIATGISAMHKAGFVHSDIKPANILIDRDPSGHFVAVIADLGSTRVVSDKALLVGEFKVATLEVLSLIYAAPELILKPAEYKAAAQLKATDIYSFAMVLFFMLMLEPPWKTVTSKQALIDALAQGQRPLAPVGALQRIRADTKLTMLYDLMMICTAVDVEVRPDIERILDRLSKS